MKAPTNNRILANLSNKPRRKQVCVVRVSGLKWQWKNKLFPNCSNIFGSHWFISDLFVFLSSIDTQKVVAHDTEINMLVPFLF